MRRSPIPVPQTQLAFHPHTRSLRGQLRDQTHRELVYRSLQFQKRSQLFIGTHHETLSVAMRVNDPVCSPLRIHG
jgi:hypothetical protein